MNKYTFLFVAIALFFMSCENKKTQEKKCSETERLVSSVAWYQRSAEMKVLYRQAYEFAKIKLEKNLADRPQDARPAAVVLDIDETVLDNSPFEVKAIETDTAYSSKTWKRWVDQGKATALPGAIDFTKWAKEQGIEVFYISNRRVNTLDVTVENLKKEGFPNAEKKFVLLRSNTSDKTERRASVKQTHEILLYIGDNLTDFSQTFKNRENNFGFDTVNQKWDSIQNYFVQLPNPMYGDWMSHLKGKDKKSSACDRDKSIKSFLKSY